MSLFAFYFGKAGSASAWLPLCWAADDDALMGQLRVAGGAVAHALIEVPCQQPPQPALQPQRRT
jgi:hypothetical protein